MRYFRFLVKRYLFAILSVVFVIVYWNSAGKLPAKAVIFPKFITYIIIALFIWVFIQSIIEYRALVKNTAVDEKEKWKISMNLTRPKIVITAATALYIVFVYVFGYIISTVLYVGGLSFYLGNRKPLKLILFTGLFFGVLYCIFVLWLRVNVPAGLIFGR